jgi:hypothetical protein
MTIEYVAEDGKRVRIPRGWVILTLALAAWGVVCIIGCAISGLLHLLA